MKAVSYFAAAAVLLTATTAAAQFVPTPEPSNMTGNRMPEQFWAAKPTTPTPYTAPNKVHWKLSEILASKRGQTDWVQPIVRNNEQEADYISLGAGKKTKAKFYGDDRVTWIVQDGAMRVTVEGREPFVATKGFMVSIPFRNPYTIETVGDKPSLRFEVRTTGSVPLYPASVTPDPYPGRTYVKVTGTPGPSKIGTGGSENPLYVDFLKDVAVGDKTHSAKFVWDDNFTSNILRGKAPDAVPPDTNLGHFHVDWTEFWFIAEGKIGYKIEGFPYFEADQGDVVTAAEGRWHRAGNSPKTPMSTRIPFNPRPPILHNFEVPH